MKAKKLRRLARRYRLEAPQDFWTGSEVWLEDVANGIGPDRWPEERRQAIRDLLAEATDPDFADAVVVCAAIHDVEYHLGQTDADRAAADDRFGRNLRRCARARHPWPERWLIRTVRRPFLAEMAAAIAMEQVVERCGAEAFRAGKEQAHGDG